MSDYVADLELALRLADAADQVTMERFQAADLAVETKPDLTPVSDADRACEQKIRQILASERPEDGVYGEEFGADSGASRRWIIDPIDGTKNYVRGVPVWATLIALAVGEPDNQEVVVGVVSVPALRRRWWAASGQGAWTDFDGQTKPISVSKVARLEDSSLSYSSLTGWQARGALPEFLQLQEKCWRTRAYGDFYSYMLVAEGCVDMAAEPELELYDMAALVPIISEAGGRFTSWSGQPGPWGGDGVATNGLLHDELLKYLA